ncbi:hypothetical protein DXT99_24485 [Pontibacter diazotrophicus]|uniref:EF-hand domain-containing protein n=1 Tax=Pontibacter diazotrophicus TaxID=1400979 RepID=A0A3D8L249_9BACT|nr:hypothetical protein [Pontibacter diazotrophicus]RDV11494.1 hypothetical protein DXT99_24485 [Pontibacter diazotrophicus]
MERRETNALKVIVNGISLFLMTGMVACYGGREVVEDEVVTYDLNKPEGVTVDDVGATVDVSTVDTWDRDEFYTTFIPTNYYEDWDVNDDSFLNEDEFAASFFQIWDTDNDGMIEDIEWNAAVTDYGLDETDWDIDGDGYIEPTEFNTGFPDTGWYEAWDTDGDGLIELREYTDGVFTIWDKDDDGVLDTTEYAL